MKISHILIIAVVALLFVSSAATNLVLKKQFEQIDRNDPTYGFSRDSLKPFSYVKLQGKGFGLTEIKQGEKAEIKMITEQKYLDWKITNDTLVLTYKGEWNRPNHVDFQMNPSIYIVTPTLSGITNANVPCIVRKFNGGNLNVIQTGSGLMLSESTFSNLNADVSDKGLLKFDGQSKIGNATLSIGGQSTFEADKNIFGDLKTDIDDEAMVRIPASLMNKLSKP